MAQRNKSIEQQKHEDLMLRRLARIYAQAKALSALTKGVDAKRFDMIQDQVKQVEEHLERALCTILQLNGYGTVKPMPNPETVETAPEMSVPDSSDDLETLVADSDEDFDGGEGDD